MKKKLLQIFGTVLILFFLTGVIYATATCTECIVSNDSDENSGRCKARQDGYGDSCVIATRGPKCSGQRDVACGPIP